MLRQRCENIPANFPNLHQLINNMWKTMYAANGCGLAAPQIGQAVRLFVIDSKTTCDNLSEEDRSIYFEKHDTGITETFINATIVQRSPQVWIDEEGCLSIPGITQPVKRPWSITIEYSDQHFKRQCKTFSGATARMIQHEYDHTEGILYLDYLKPLTKKLLQGKLKRIAQGIAHR
jgi:peptide deformylase